MKQNTTDMSGRKALSGRQKHLPKYLHLLLLFIHHQCGDLLLVFGEHLFSPFFTLARAGCGKPQCTHHILCLQPEAKQMKCVLILCLTDKGGYVYVDD